MVTQEQDPVIEKLSDWMKAKQFKQRDISDCSLAAEIFLTNLNTNRTENPLHIGITAHSARPRLLSDIYLEILHAGHQDLFGHEVTRINKLFSDVFNMSRDLHYFHLGYVDLETKSHKGLSLEEIMQLVSRQHKSQVIGISGKLASSS